MKFLCKRLVCSLALAGLMSACGGDNDKNDWNTPKLSQYAGRITDELGTPVAGLSIRLENRVTDEVTEVVSSADGSFSAEVDPGTYDIIFDDMDNVKFVSLLKTAVDLRDPRNEDVKIQKANGLAKNLFTGLVTDVNGSPAANRTLLILPAIAKVDIGKAELPDPFLLQTDVQGKFSSAMGTAGIDFDFDLLVIAPDAPKLAVEKLAMGYEFSSEEAKNTFAQEFDNYVTAYAQESVDVEKPDGAMHINLVIGSSTHNLRSATGVPTMVAGAAEELDKYEKNQKNAEVVTLQSAIDVLKINAGRIFMKVIPSAYAMSLDKKFEFTSYVNDNKGKSTGGAFHSGQVTFGTGGFKFWDMLVDPKNIDPDFAKNSGFDIGHEYVVKTGEHKISIILNANREGLYDFYFKQANSSMRVFKVDLKRPHKAQFKAAEPRVDKVIFNLD